MYMQNNVNATNVINYAVQNFGEDNVQTCDAGVIKVYVKELRNGDILTISNMLQWSDIQVKRSNTQLMILLIPKLDQPNYGDDLINAIEEITERG